MLKSFQRPPKPHKQRVEKEVFSAGLTGIGPSTSGEYAFLHLNVSSKGLQSILGIESFPHLQHINLSHNNLVSLAPLSGIELLLTLDASHNSLRALNDFEGSNLIYADYSHNSIESMKKADVNRYLQILRLDNNAIEEISCIESLPNLQLLSLHFNSIDKISGLPPSLQELHLSHNAISKIGYGLTELKLLRTLDLSYNKISSLRGLECLESLMVLKLSGNLIRKVLSLEPVSQIALVSDIELIDNPVTEINYYRLRVAFKMPQLRSLDGNPLTAEEKIKAENLYGLDLEDRKSIFKEIFPDQQFIDRRLVTSDMLDYESESDREDLEFIEQGTLSKVNSQGSMGSEIAAFAKRYVGELIDKAQEIYEY